MCTERLTGNKRRGRVIDGFNMRAGAVSAAHLRKVFGGHCVGRVAVRSRNTYPPMTGLLGHTGGYARIVRDILTGKLVLYRPIAAGEGGVWRR